MSVLRIDIFPFSTLNTHGCAYWRMNTHDFPVRVSRGRRCTYTFFLSPILQSVRAVVCALERGGNVWFERGGGGLVENRMGGVGEEIRNRRTQRMLID